MKNRDGQAPVPFIWRMRGTEDRAMTLEGGTLAAMRSGIRSRGIPMCWNDNPGKFLTVLVGGENSSIS